MDLLSFLLFIVLAHYIWKNIFREQDRYRVKSEVDRAKDYLDKR